MIADRAGRVRVIVGTSGSGKSTLLHMLGGLDYPSEGKVLVDGKDISALKEDALAIFRRRKIGFVFQSYNLVPVLNVYENIVFPIQLDGNEVDRKYIDSIVKTLGLENRVKRASLPALRRTAAEGGDSKGAGGQTGHYSGGRTHGKSGHKHQSGRAGAS